MNEKQLIKKIEKLGYGIETQPKYKITSDVDDDFFIETNNLKKFLKECVIKRKATK